MSDTEKEIDEKERIVALEEQVSQLNKYIGKLELQLSSQLINIMRLETNIGIVQDKLKK